MRLTYIQRVTLTTLAVILLGLAILGAAKNWPVTFFAALLPAWTAGLFVIHGSVPHGSWKELSFQWPDLETLKLVQQLQDEVASFRQDLNWVRSEQAAALTNLEAHVLGQQAPPDDGLTDEERLSDLEAAFDEAWSELDWRHYQAVGRTDGATTSEVLTRRRATTEALEREKRRQSASDRIRKGMTVMPEMVRLEPLPSEREGIAD